MTSGANAPDRAPQSPRQHSRAAATRQALLTAARDVFAVAGFAEASIADVVDRAGASVGSLYHHFGGKADLYLALYEQFADSQEARAAAAVAAARPAAGGQRAELFLAGARAYLEGCWAQRDVARLFLAGGGPPGFELVVRRRHRDWVRANAALLRAEEEPFDEALVLVLTTVVGEAGAEVAISESAGKATALADAVLELVARVMTPRR